MTKYDALGAAQPAPSTLPLTPVAAKRLLGVLKASSWPVVYAGHRVTVVQRKRHPYSDWETMSNAYEVDTQNASLRYRVVLQCGTQQPTEVPHGPTDSKKQSALRPNDRTLHLGSYARREG